MHFPVRPRDGELSTHYCCSFIIPEDESAEENTNDKQDAATLCKLQEYEAMKEFFGPDVSYYDLRESLAEFVGVYVPAVQEEAHWSKPAKVVSPGLATRRCPLSAFANKCVHAHQLRLCVAEHLERWRNKAPEAPVPSTAQVSTSNSTVMLDAAIEARAVSARSAEAAAMQCNELLAELASSALAQQVQQLADASARSDMAELGCQRKIRPSDLQQRRTGDQTAANDRDSLKHLNSTVNASSAEAMPVRPLSSALRVHTQAVNQPPQTHTETHPAPGMEICKTAAGNTAAHAAMHCNTTSNHSSSSLKARDSIKASKAQSQEAHSGLMSLHPDTPDHRAEQPSSTVFKHAHKKGRSRDGRPEVGDIVWARLQGQPFWPAQVTLAAVCDKLFLLKC